MRKTDTLSLDFLDHDDGDRRHVQNARIQVFSN
jgi:hypothetical protein